MKKIILILSALLSLGGAYTLTGCGGGDDSNNNNTPQGNQQVNKTDSEVAINQPKVVRVYIDGSGSMDGYLGDKDNLHSLSAALTSLIEVPEDQNIEYIIWGQDKPIKQEDIVKTLTAGKLNGAYSHYHGILDSMVNYTGKAGSDTLAVLITDGILSSSRAKTDRTKEYTNYEKEVLAPKIKAALKDKNKAISMYRIMGHFDGNYLDKANNGHAYKGGRPFFAVVLGNPANVRYFDRAAKNDKINKVYTDAEAIHLGTTPTMKFEIDPEGEGNDTTDDGKELVLQRDNPPTYNYTGLQGFYIGGDLPKWLVDEYDSNILKRNSEVLIDGKVNKSIEISIENDHVSFKLPKEIAEKNKEYSKEYTITYRIIDPSLKDWDDYSTEDDTTPNDTQTYLLKDFVGALRQGILGDKTIILEQAITIVPD